MSINIDPVKRPTSSSKSLITPISLVGDKDDNKIDNLNLNKLIKTFQNITNLTEIIIKMKNNDLEKVLELITHYSNILTTENSFDITNLNSKKNILNTVLYEYITPTLTSLTNMFFGIQTSNINSSYAIELNNCLYKAIMIYCLALIKFKNLLCHKTNITKLKCTNMMTSLFNYDNTKFLINLNKNTKINIEVNLNSLFNNIDYKTYNTLNAIIIYLKTKLNGNNFNKNLNEYSIMLKKIINNTKYYKTRHNKKNIEIEFDNLPDKIKTIIGKGFMDDIDTNDIKDKELKGVIDFFKDGLKDTCCIDKKASGVGKRKKFLYNNKALGPKRKKKNTSYIYDNDSDESDDNFQNINSDEDSNDEDYNLLNERKRFYDNEEINDLKTFEELDGDLDSFFNKYSIDTDSAYDTQSYVDFLSKLKNTIINYQDSSEFLRNSTKNNIFEKIVSLINQMIKNMTTYYTNAINEYLSIEDIENERINDEIVNIINNNKSLEEIINNEDDKIVAAVTTFSYMKIYKILFERINILMDSIKLILFNYYELESDLNTFSNIQYSLNIITCNFLKTPNIFFNNFIPFEWINEFRKLNIFFYDSFVNILDNYIADFEDTYIYIGNFQLQPIEFFIIKNENELYLKNLIQFKKNIFKIKELINLFISLLLKNYFKDADKKYNYYEVDYKERSFIQDGSSENDYMFGIFNLLLYKKTTTLVNLIFYFFESIININIIAKNKHVENFFNNILNFYATENFPINIELTILRILMSFLIIYNDNILLSEKHKNKEPLSTSNIENISIVQSYHEIFKVFLAKKDLYEKYGIFITNDDFNGHESIQFEIKIKEDNSYSNEKFFSNFKINNEFFDKIKNNNELDLLVDHIEGIQKSNNNLNYLNDENEFIFNMNFINNETVVSKKFALYLLSHLNGNIKNICNIANFKKNSIGFCIKNYKHYLKSIRIILVKNP